ncbi:M20/M25/M40 family metallo-hydrolase [Streptosporangium sp. NPDC023615]|uniref:M20/M25/M40 family metallo-hydrolase n=1 Tax=Streptosporangium sp. NPDC023615 TaxID=3154794 RepID=UPI003442255B
MTTSENRTSPAREDASATRTRWSLASGLVALGVLLLAAVGAVVDITPFSVSPADAPGRDFSARRAFSHIERFATAPHPVGTAEHARVREYLVDELRRMGLRPEVQEATGVAPSSLGAWPAVAGRVLNIVALIPGTAPTGRVFVTAHYDSVPEGPGANDDGAGTASALEAARALLADGRRPRNDVVLLITDGEEAGLLGAEAFVAGHPLARGRSVVLNHEARGAKGPVLMFRSTRPNAGLISVFGSAAPHPVADSTFADLMEILPNDTDFTAFAPAGMSVLDSAFAGAGTYYHSVLDDPSRVDLPTLQQMGDNTLALVRAFGDADLARTADGQDLVYFNVPPGILVRYPAWAASVLGGLAFVATLALVLLARRRGAVTLRRTLLATVSALIPIGLTVGAGLVFWDALTTIRPDLGGTATTTPYRPEPFWLALLALAITVPLAWYALLRRRLGSRALALGMLIWTAFLGLGLGVASPGSSHSLAWPALGAALGGLAALYAPARWRVPALTAGLLPAALILAPGTWTALPMGLAYAGYAVMPQAVLLVGLTLPLVEFLWPRRRSLLVPLAALAVSIVLVGVGLRLERTDADHPRRTGLGYGLDADTGKAVWVTSASPDAWARRYGGPASAAHPFPDVWTGPALVGPARAATLAAPSVKVVEDTVAGGVRTLRVRIRSERGAPQIGLRLDAPATAALRSLTVAGRPLPKEAAGGSGERPGETSGERRGAAFTFHAPGPEGVEVSLTLAGHDGPLRLRVTDVSSAPGDMAAIPGYVPPPEWMFLAGSRVAVAKTHTVVP